jgi:tRNA (guanine37-N1)-methyltransferase
LQNSPHFFAEIIFMAGDIAAGVGPFALTSAKKVWRVFANDENAEALKYLAKNVEENRLQAKVEVSVILVC